MAVCDGLSNCSVNPTGFVCVCVCDIETSTMRRPGGAVLLPRREKINSTLWSSVSLLNIGSIKCESVKVCCVEFQKELSKLYGRHGKVLSWAFAD